MAAITELYQLLFGKNHIKDGDVINMAEHGRNGGVSTGQPFKFVGIAPLSVQTATNSSLSITGFAKPGTNTSLPNWRLMAEDANGNVLWADGNENFDNIFVDFNTKTFTS